MSAPTLLEAAQRLAREFSRNGHHSTDAMRRPVFIVYLPKAETEALLSDLESAIARES
jgi:hypothetical protein